MTTNASEPLHWAVFFAIVAIALAIDLGFVGRKGDVVSTRTAYAWSAVWISLGIGFSGLVYLWYGGEAAQQYLAGYLIEESLSIDNLFVFLLVFGSLGIALQYQRKVLFWGILGAMLMRGVFIVAGVSLINRFEWIVYIFGAVLVYTAYRLVRSSGVQVEPEKNPLVRFARRLFPVAADYKGAPLRHPPRRQDGSSRRWCSPWSPSSRPTSCSPSTRSRPCSPSPTSRSWSSPATSPRSSGCARSTSRSPAACSASSTSAGGSPSCWGSSASRC